MLPGADVPAAGVQVKGGQPCELAEAAVAPAPGAAASPEPPEPAAAQEEPQPAQLQPQPAQQPVWRRLGSWLRG